MKQIPRGRIFTVSGIDRAALETTVLGCLNRAGFLGVAGELADGSRLINAKTRASWARIVLSALPPHLDIQLSQSSDRDGIEVRYNDRYGLSYLLYLVSLAAILGPLLVKSVTMVFRLATAPTLPQEFSASTLWLAGALGLVFARAFMASGAGTVARFAEDIREQLRQEGASVDQQETGTLTSKALGNLLFLAFVVGVLALAFLSMYDAFAESGFNRTPSGIMMICCVAGLLVIGVMAVRGIGGIVRPVGGEERFAAVATGVSIQLGVLCLLGGQPIFHLIGQTDHELRSSIFRAQASLEPGNPPLTSPEGEVVPRSRLGSVGKLHYASNFR